ncbi:hypothetical protein VTN00DRAFT_3633 [Thermoascus crustaceus]|uniref:uncharacterized protein n=1 Tax=Thermoascus crustaceus TaxID=5088 RepID=UPI003742FBF6
MVMSPPHRYRVKQTDCTPSAQFTFLPSYGSPCSTGPSTRCGNEPIINLAGLRSRRTNRTKGGNKRQAPPRTYPDICTLWEGTPGRERKEKEEKKGQLIRPCISQNVKLKSLLSAGTIGGKSEV